MAKFLVVYVTDIPTTQANELDEQDWAANVLDGDVKVYKFASNKFTEMSVEQNDEYDEAAGELEFVVSWVDVVVYK